MNEPLPVHNPSDTPSAPLSPAETRRVAALLDGYASGAFLMSAPTARGGLGPAHWYDAAPRAILPLTPQDGLHVPRRLARTARHAPFDITLDRAFEAVIRACADPARPGRWISDEIIDAFALLRRAGHAHSVEAWTRVPDPSAPAGGAPRLVGGLYGLAIGGAFCAEAMFSRPDQGGRDASKLCLLRLVEHLRARGFGLCDVQLANPHLAQFGVREIPRGEYLRLLRAQLRRAVTWS